MYSVKPDRFPFFYGWIIVALGLISMSFWTGIRSSFSVFYVALLDEFGWSRGGAAGVQSISFLVYLGVSPLIGTLIDRFGPKKVIIPGIFILSFGLFLSSSIGSLAQFYLFYGIVVAIGVSFISIVAYSPILAQWFERRRGFAVGFAVSGMGLGTFLLVPLAQYFISLWGWRYSFCALGALIFVILFPANLIFLRYRPSDHGLEPDGISSVLSDKKRKKKSIEVIDDRWANTEWTLKKALSTFRYWALLFFAFLSITPVYMMVIHSVRFLVDHGLDKMASAFILSLVGIISLFFRIFWGWLSDRVGREVTSSMGAFFIMLSALLLIFIESTGIKSLSYLFAISLGIGWGVTAPMFISTSADLFQGRHFGLIYGVVEAVIGGGCAFGAWFAGFIFDRFHNYRYAFMTASLFALLSIICIWFSAPRKVRRVRVR
ncbi:MAG: MFS transporter [Syntrophorhabdaceae bacterium]|nr:MFS transporter [Syntrophorhabdaceae bacterium]